MLIHCYFKTSFYESCFHSGFNVDDGNNDTDALQKDEEAMTTDLLLRNSLIRTLDRKLSLTKENTAVLSE